MGHWNLVPVFFCVQVEKPVLLESGSPSLAFIQVWTTTVISSLWSPALAVYLATASYLVKCQYSSLLLKLLILSKSGKTDLFFLSSSAAY